MHSVPSPLRLRLFSPVLDGLEVPVALPPVIVSHPYRLLPSFAPAPGPAPLRVDGVHDIVVAVVFTPDVFAPTEKKERNTVAFYLYVQFNFGFQNEDCLFFCLVWRDSGDNLKDRISSLPLQPCWLYALIALQKHSPLLRRYHPSENWLSSRCLTSVIVRKLAFPT